jgi:hypothetical protein
MSSIGRSTGGTGVAAAGITATATRAPGYRTVSATSTLSMSGE